MLFVVLMSRNCKCSFSVCSFIASSDFYCLLMIFTSGLDPDKNRHTVVLDLDLKGLTC